MVLVVHAEPASGTAVDQGCADCDTMARVQSSLIGGTCTVTTFPPVAGDAYAYVKVQPYPAPPAQPRTHTARMVPNLSRTQVTDVATSGTARLRHAPIPPVAFMHTRAPWYVG